MAKNFTWKLVLIFATLLVFLFGIFGVPKDWSGKGLLASMTDRIKLGLDLKGGTHLILQVKVNYAFNVDSAAAIERMKEAMRAAKINYAEIPKPDPVNHPEQIVIKGVPPESSADLGSIVTDRMPEYNLASGAKNSWTIAMKAQALTSLKDQSVTQAIELSLIHISEPTRLLSIS